jgi:hypothetical protein
MSLTAGGTVGRYQIQGLLGSGGMGEVYKAVDSTLGRPVALKVLRPELSRDPERLSRFLHEARAASGLNHPNILTIHEVGDHDGSRFLVSELVDGETLRDRVNRAPLTLREILDVTIQTASALSAAHAAGIVHRDVKPDNLMLRPDGYVKVLDFGVATFARRVGSSQDTEATIAPTIETGDGIVVGTIAYMSPEQARGLPVDGRSDCYSLGVVLYELVTGRAPFAAPTTTDLLVAILEREPAPVRSVARGLPVQLEWIIEKSLEKDPNLRYQTIADLRVDLQRLKTALESGRLAASATADAAPAADREIERELTDDSPEVVAVSGVSWLTGALPVTAAILLGVAMSYYHLARPGADVPLALPEGGVITKARDVIQEFGYADAGSRTDTNFDEVLEPEDIARMTDLATARAAIKEGEPVAEWRASVTRTANPSTGNMEPRPGDFTVSLDPRGRLIAFATGAAEGTIAHAERTKAASIGVEAIKKSFGVDATTGYDLEIIERTFPAGKTEMTWRSSATKYGHVEQFRVNLQGEQTILIDRSYQRPRGYTTPETPLLMRILKGVAPVVVVSVFVGGWGFGLYYLFKTRNWDALTRRMPLAICALIIVQVAISNNGDSGPIGTLLAIAAIAILLLGTVLPALSGVLLWIGRRSPARMWAAEQITRGRLFAPSVPVSIVEGVSAGTVVAALTVLVDWAALSVPGFLPSISRELGVVDSGIGVIVGNALSGSTFLALAIAFAIEVFDKFKVPAVVSTAVIGLAAGFAGASDQEALLPILAVSAGFGLAAGIVELMYRRGGLLAAWLASFVAFLLPEALAAQSLELPELQRTTNTLLTLVAIVAAAGLWGAGRKLLHKNPPALNLNT